VRAKKIFTHKELKSYIDNLGNEPSADEFQTVLTKALEFGLTKKQIAEGVGTSQASVERWVLGSSIPYPRVRNMLVMTVCDML
jgi:hypothetical protein